MKLKRILTSCFAVSALVSGQALADSEVRGAVTAVSNVASGVRTTLTTVSAGQRKKC